ncbi:protein suppressor of underreplication [Stomoxys calcitrans]|uniref:protein suppressor of underreplication n=1 Tax=Stomoxys calcitrans TaxID=35570 RepID=UPI0027E22BD6|nr:protein suppressor of underreplication [Stomoxys calcitrans]XP_059216208.1 protein suppressor of underreplication [Stomoxys calcitrans]
MYHFVADHPPVAVRLSFRAQIPGHVRQYLKQFQIDACIFMHNFLAKGELCVYNDESGLGKQAAVAVLLDAACANRKSLIIVQNDENYVLGWEFHFSVLTNCNVKVIKDNKDSIDSPHNVYIAKWSTLRALDDLSKFDFDYVIVDNRGQMLNNTFCMSMLLKYYERKVNILISSVDITSDLKLLHNILKLGGRLEPRYSNFKQFEEKFKLPDAKELTYKRVDLEEYFLKRERLADYCKNFRLRRYCHQYEQHLPLVPADRYKINLDIFREKQNATNSESSSVEIATQNRPDERVRDTQELFEEYCRQRRKQQELEKLKQQKQQREQEHQQLQKMMEEREKQQKEREMQDVLNLDDEVAFINETPPIVAPDKQTGTRDNSDEAIVMSPLLLVSDSEDTNDVPEICNDPTDDDNIVDLSSDDEENEDNDVEDDNEGASQTSEKEKDEAGTENVEKERHTVKKKERKKKLTEHDRLKADVATNLKFQNETTPKRRTRNAEENPRLVSGKKRGNVENIKVTPKSKDMRKQQPSKEVVARKNDIPLKSNKNNDKDNTANKTPTLGKTNMSGEKDKSSQKETSAKRLRTVQNPQKGEEKENTASTPRESRTSRRSDQAPEKENTNTSSTPLSTRPKKSHVNRNDSPGDKNKATTTPTTPITPNMVIKTEPLEDYTPQSRRSLPTKDLTNTLQRIKRELNVEHVVMHNRETRSAKRSTRSAGSSGRNMNAVKNSLFSNDKPKHKKTTTPNKGGEEGKRQTTPQSKSSKPSNADVNVNDTQAPVISMTCSQDYDPIQCAQRLSDVSARENNTQKKRADFLIPATPISTRNSLIPSSIMSSSSFFGDSEVIFVPPTPPVDKASGKKTTKDKKTDDVIVVSGSDTDSSSMNLTAATSRRTRALKPRRAAAQNQSEDSNSKVPTFSQLLAQHNTRTSAKSPDLFSNCSDLAQQLPCSQNANTEETNAPFEGFKIFGSEVKQLQQHYALTTQKTQNAGSSSNHNKSNNSGKKSYRDRSCLDILENMFEPPNKKQKTKGTATSSEGNDAAAKPSTAAASAMAETNNSSSPSRRNKQKTKVQGPIVPNHPLEAIAEAHKALKERQRSRSIASSSVLEDEIFEITNNGTFGSVMRLHSNGEISPVHQAQKSTQNNKITKYFQGGLTQTLTGSQEDSGNNSEAGTPSKQSKQQQQQQQPQQQPTQQQQQMTSKKSPKPKCNPTQVTKLTKWFTKNSPSKHQQQQQQMTQVASSKSNAAAAAASSPSAKRNLKRRRLDLTRAGDESD